MKNIKYIISDLFLNMFLKLRLWISINFFKDRIYTKHIFDYSDWNLIYKNCGNNNDYSLCDNPLHVQKHGYFKFKYDTFNKGDIFNLFKMSSINNDTEIDVYRINIGKNKGLKFKSFNSTIRWKNYKKDLNFKFYKVKVYKKSNKKYDNYAVEWDPLFIKFYYNDVLVRQYSNPETLQNFNENPLKICIDKDISFEAYSKKESIEDMKITEIIFKYLTIKFNGNVEKAMKIFTIADINHLLKYGEHMISGDFISVNNNELFKHKAIIFKNKFKNEELSICDEAMLKDSHLEMLNISSIHNYNTVVKDIFKYNGLKNNYTLEDIIKSVLDKNKASNLIKYCKSLKL